MPVELARAEAEARRAETHLPWQGILPTARIEAGAVRTTDPIGAFGTLLRQRRVTPAVFDPARLNDPAPITNVTGGLVVEVPIINADALLAARAMRSIAKAQDAQLAWTTQSTERAVVEAYFGAMLATERVQALDTALTAATAGAQQVRAMDRQGLVTPADLLQATVQISAVATQVNDARHAARTARQQLALLLGRPATDVPELPSAMPTDAQLQAAAARDTADTPTRSMQSPETRADLEAIRANVSAAKWDAARSVSLLAPRLNGFARLDWNAPGTLFAGRRNWTLGVMASWTVFNGGQALGAAEAATARHRAAQLGERAAQRSAALEQDITRRELVLAMERLTATALQRSQSAEAQRLVARRYAGGLATIAEVLAADAAATGSALQHTTARYAVITALAARRLATAADLMTLATLDASQPFSR